MIFWLLSKADCGSVRASSATMLLIQNSTTERGVVQHYRAGLAIDNSSENARDAYRQAWHLAAGLLPRQRHACFGD